VRILLLSQHFWPESFRINDVALALRAAGHEVVVLTGQPNYPGGAVFAGYRAFASGQQWHQGLEIQRVPLLPRGPGSALRLLANYLSFIVSAALVGGWRLRRRQFDVVFVYGTSPILQALAAVYLARLKGCALVTWVQDLWPQSLQVTGYVSHPRVLAAVGAMVRWTYQRCDLLLVQSHGFEAPVRELAGATPVAHQPNPSGDTKHAPGVRTEPALTLPTGFNVIFAGNLGTAQALDSILDAAALLSDLPDVHITLVGSGQRSAWLAEQVQQRGLAPRVLLPGRFPPEAMPAILAQASALLVSLAADPTMALTVPSKLQSYLAAGRPIIAALDGEGARIVAESGAGICCPPGNAPALADAIRRLHAMPAEAHERMGAAGSHYHAAHFALDTVAAQLAAHLRAAAASHRRRAATIAG
jgi:glycosyltransferase involved in cell wall biosynthesis